MKREVPPSSRGLLLVYRVLTALLLVLAALVIGFTVYAFARPKDSAPLFSFGSAGEGGMGQGGGNAGTAAPSNSAEVVFNGIGRLRIPAAAGRVSGDAIVILSIAFPYPPGDGPFTEELASHIGDFRSIATDYFASLPAEKIVKLDEGAAKDEILRRYNALLRLGKISVLYFNDLMVVE